MRVEIIRANGTRQTYHAPFSRIGELIKAETLDTINLRDGRVMLVNDRGYEIKTVQHENKIELRPVRALLPVNAEATRMYHAVCVPGTTHEIVGDVAIVVDADSED